MYIWSHGVWVFFVSNSVWATNRSWSVYLSNVQFPLHILSPLAPILVHTSSTEWSRLNWTKFLKQVHSRSLLKKLSQPYFFYSSRPIWQVLHIIFLFLVNIAKTYIKTAEGKECAVTFSENQRSRLKLIYFFLFLPYLYWYSLVQSETYFTQMVVKRVRDFSPLVKIITNSFLKLLSAKYIFYFNMSNMVPTFTQIMTVGTDFELTFIEVQGCCSLDCKKTSVYHILFWLYQKNFLLIRNWTDLG